MFFNKFEPTRDPHKVYEDTYSYWVSYKNKTTTKHEGGSFHILYNDIFIEEQLWDKVKTTITYASIIIKPLLLMLGSKETYISLFCGSFSSLNDLYDKYVKY